MHLHIISWLVSDIFVVVLGAFFLTFVCCIWISSLTDLYRSFHWPFLIHLYRSLLDSCLTWLLGSHDSSLTDFTDDLTDHLYDVSTDHIFDHPWHVFTDHHFISDICLQVISLIISDVIGDPLDLISSGPTVRQTYSPLRCLDVIDRLNARSAIPERVMSLLETRRSQLIRKSKLTTDPRGVHGWNLSSFRLKSVEWKQTKKPNKNKTKNT